MYSIQGSCLTYALALKIMVKNHTYQDLNGNNNLSASLKLLYKKKFVISPILTYYNVHLRLRFQLIPYLHEDRSKLRMTNP